MKIIDARIDWMVGFGNSPRIEVLVDKMVRHEEFRYDTVRFTDGCTAAFAVKDGMVDFLYHNPKNELGYGGRTFVVKTLDGETLRFKGPWSSNSFSMYSVFGIPCAEVSITDDPEAFKKGYTFFSGHITGEVYEQMMAEFFPEVEWEFGSWSGNPGDEEKGYKITKPKDLPKFCEGRTVQYKWKTTFHAYGENTHTTTKEEEF